jgi:hypothetical protein
MNFKNERSQLHFMFTLCKMGHQHQIKKMNESKLEKKVTITSRFFKVSSCHITYAHVV